MSKRSSYNNPNGEMSIEEMIRIKNNSELEQFMQNFRVTKNKCPNNTLKPKKVKCFRCIECFMGAFDSIKEYKNYYKIGKIKYPKEEYIE